MPPVKGSHYDDDFYTWTQTQAALLREGKGNVSDLDYVNLAEEIESLGKRDRRTLESRLERLTQHLLKWCYQAVERPRHGRSWQRTIWEQRRQLARLLRDNPSFRREVPDVLAAGYAHARRLALSETRVPAASMPSTCPWTAAQLLDEDFWPEPLQSDAAEPPGRALELLDEDTEPGSTR